MTNKRNTKRALMASLISMLLCLTMLIGSTFAWFTDNASTEVNTIKAGNLNITLMMKQDDSWVDAEDKTVGFKTADGREQTAILWEPGCRYELQELKLVNNGNLHAKYKVIISATTGDVDLANVIDVYETVNSEETNLGTLRSFLDKADGIKEGVIAPNEELAFGTLKLVMQESAGNQYMDKSIENIAITVLATQANVESDSYDNTYDKDAEYCEFASDSAEFVELLSNAPTNGELLVVKVAEDMEIQEQISVPAGSNVVVDMNGKTLTASEGALVEGKNYGWIFYPQDDANLVITGNGTYDMQGIDVALVVQGRADITIENGTFINSGKAEKGYTLINGSQNQNHTLTIKGGYFDSGFYEEGNCHYNQRTCINSSWGNQVKIYGGTFVGFNPIAGDEGMAYQCPDCDQSANEKAYCQGVFLDGQNWKSEEIPAGYTITGGTTEDGVPTYTVNYTAPAN